MSKEKLYRYLKFILFGVLCFIVLSLIIYFITNETCSFCFSLGLKPSEIGDAIGGITAPIINIIAAYLVYISFVAQTTANRKQFEILENELKASDMERNFQTLFTIINNLENELNSLEYTSILPKKNTYTGIKAIQVHNNNMKILPDLNYNETKQILPMIMPLLSKRKNILQKLLLISDKLKTMNLSIDSKILICELYTNFYKDNLSNYDDDFLDMGTSNFSKIESSEFIDLYNFITKLDQRIHEDKGIYIYDLKDFYNNTLNHG